MWRQADALLYTKAPSVMLQSNLGLRGILGLPVGCQHNFSRMAIRWWNVVYNFSPLLVNGILLIWSVAGDLLGAVVHCRRGTVRLYLFFFYQPPGVRGRLALCVDGTMRIRVSSATCYMSRGNKVLLSDMFTRRNAALHTRSLTRCTALFLHCSSVSDVM